MIQANELRIGNWVSVKSLWEDQIYSVSEGAVTLRANGLFPLEVINPIPITPEILEKCGFVSNPYQDRYELGDIHFEYCAIRNIVWCEKYPHIKYLHQLQNLYFALTGEELSYTP